MSVYDSSDFGAYMAAATKAVKAFVTQLQLALGRGALGAAKQAWVDRAQRLLDDFSAFQARVQPGDTIAPSRGQLSQARGFYLRARAAAAELEKVSRVASQVDPLGDKGEPPATITDRLFNAAVIAGCVWAAVTLLK